LRDTVASRASCRAVIDKYGLRVSSGRCLWLWPVAAQVVSGGDSLNSG